MYRKVFQVIIKNIEISNFRTLNVLKIDFHPEVNFIVRLNNTGKSNLLRLLNTLK
ncbi:AAA family ATPase [Thermaerobacillus caldiproteolyticus]|uniref:AAA family ATPase n=1 Tax=Thermaerobacillus caldiproteolyticus TaxID=247480 RepID=UPI0035A984A8